MTEKTSVVTRGTAVANSTVAVARAPRRALTARRGVVACAAFVASFAAFVAASLAGAGVASASTVVAKAGGDVHASELRIAIANGQGRSVVWEQLAVDTSRGELAWLLPVAKGGWVEAGDATWFSALDAVSAPRIAPAPALACASAPRESTVDPPPSSPPRAVDHASAAMSGAAAIERLRADGFVVDARTAAELSTLDLLGEQVVILHLPPGPPGLTPVARAIAPASSARALPLTLVPLGAPQTSVRAYAIATTRSKLAGVGSTEPEWERLEWMGGRSSYGTLLADARATAGDGVVTIFASPDAIFADEPAGAVGQSIPSLVRAYFGADDAAPTEVWSCAKRAAAYSTRPAVVSASCAKAPPWTSDATLPACPEAPAGETPASELECGAHDDVGVGFGGLSPASAWLTRFEMTLSPSSISRAIEDARRGSLPAFHEAKSLGAGGCGGDTPLGPGANAGGNAPTPPGATGGYGNSEPPHPPPPQVVVHDGCNGNASSCNGSTTQGGSSNDSCSKSSSGSSNDSCSGSSKSSDDGGCSKKSDGSSSDGCGSSSKSSDNGCGGSGSSGSSGCGSSSKSSDNGCALSRGRTTLRFSVVGYCAAAIAMVLRRLTRRRQAKGSRGSRGSPDR